MENRRWSSRYQDPVRSARRAAERTTETLTRMLQESERPDSRAPAAKITPLFRHRAG